VMSRRNVTLDEAQISVVMSRRNVTLDEAQISILREVMAMSAGYRNWE